MNKTENETKKKKPKTKEVEHGKRTKLSSRVNKFWQKIETCANSG